MSPKTERQLRGYGLFSITKSPGIPGIDSVNFTRMKDSVRMWGLWIGNPVP